MNTLGPPDLSLRIIGDPKTKGSVTAFVPERKGKPVPRRPNGSIVVVVKNDAGPDEEAWVKAIRLAAADGMRRRGLELLPRGCPVAIAMTFYKERGVGHYGTGRNAGIVKASAPACPAVLPDVDKMMRSALDALTGVVYEDDGQVIGGPIWKAYGSPARLDLQIWVMPRTVGALESTSERLFVAGTSTAEGPTG